MQIEAQKPKQASQDWPPHPYWISFSNLQLVDLALCHTNGSQFRNL